MNALIIATVIYFCLVTYALIYTLLKKPTKPVNLSCVKIDKIYYINLDSRKDRKEKFLSQAEKYLKNFDVERFPAIQHNPGFIGCAMSHLAVLKDARDKGYRNIIVFEDDFEFIVPKNLFHKNLQKLFLEEIDFDVVFLSYNTRHIKRFNSFLSNAKNIQTASGYLVNGKYLPTLIQTLEDGLQKLIETKDESLYANDQCWKPLQNKRWFVFSPRIGIQGASHSDIRKRFVNYKV